MSMSPQVLSRLERLGAALARVRTRRRVDALVQTHRRRVLEALPAHAALAWQRVAVLVQIVLLQMHLQVPQQVARVIGRRAASPPPHWHGSASLCLYRLCFFRCTYKYRNKWLEEFGVEPHHRRTLNFEISFSFAAFIRTTHV